MLPISSMSGSLSLKCDSYYEKHLEDKWDTWGGVSRAATRVFGCIATAALVYIDLSLCLLATALVVPLCFMNVKEHLYCTAELVAAAVLAPFLVICACQAFKQDWNCAYFNFKPSLKEIFDYSINSIGFDQNLEEINTRVIDSRARYIEDHLHDPTIPFKEKATAILWNARFIDISYGFEMLTDKKPLHPLNLILSSNLTPAEQRPLVQKIMSIVDFDEAIKLVDGEWRWSLTEHLLALEIPIHIKLNNSIEEAMFDLVRNGHIHTVELCLKELERECSDSLSALLESAIINGQDEMARLLVRYGAQILLKDISANLPEEERKKLGDMRDQFDAKKNEFVNYQKAQRKDLIDALDDKLPEDLAETVAQLAYPDDDPLSFFS